MVKIEIIKSETDHRVLNVKKNLFDFLSEPPLQRLLRTTFRRFERDVVAARKKFRVAVARAVILFVVKGARRTKFRDKLNFYA